MCMYIDMQIPVFQQLYILIVGISNFLTGCNVLIIPRQAYLLKMKILCKTVYLVSFLLEIKVLNLKACTCTYIFKCFEHCCHFVHLLSKLINNFFIMVDTILFILNKCSSFKLKES